MSLKEAYKIIISHCFQQTGDLGSLLEQDVLVKKDLSFNFPFWKEINLSLKQI